ncbi:MAG: biopolymer transporter ExbD [Bdellovibrionales bacterium]|nr:biopolymer transporter ExbD [Bdellovibrionales bacterium]
MPLKRARLQISDYNKKRKSRIAKQERRAMMVNLSLTSMVDMFAILVIFLLANQGTVNDWLKTGKDIDLPKARSEQTPPRAASLQISLTSVTGDDKTLMTTAQIRQTTAPISKWLSAVPRPGGKGQDAYVNIVADRRIPFGTIRRVIAACQGSGFGNVNLAVQPGLSRSSSPPNP